MPDTSKQKWLDKGYEHFALYGPESISINKISKEINSSRACFYHYFGDIEVLDSILKFISTDLYLKMRTTS